jgi:hypothetical protein
VGPRGNQGENNMERRKFLIGAGSAAVGASALVGSGAFTSVSADRTVSVNTTDDANALLSMDASNSENGEYTEVNTDGSIEVGLTDSANYSKNGDGSDNADGVNPDALTRIFDIFAIKNQGTQPVFVYVEPTSVEATDSGTTLTDGADDNGFYIDPQATDRPNGSYDTGSHDDLNNPNQIQDEVSLTGRYTTGFPEDDLADYPADAFKLNVGQSFNFGLYIKGGDGSFDSDITMTIDAVDYDLVSPSE